MNAKATFDLMDQRLDQLPIADGWARSVTKDLERSRNRAWFVAIVASLIALLLAVALLFLVPLKTVEPYTLLVDRQTGHVQALAPLDAQLVTPDSALTRSMLVQYVIARESFSQTRLQEDYRRVSLMSDGAERQRYQRLMQAGNPQSPLSYLPTSGVIRTEIKSISSLNENRAMVRFVTARDHAGGASQQAEHWAAVIDFQFTSAAMSEADRHVNPLGFQVTRYRRDAETLVEDGTLEGVRQGGRD